MINYLKSLILLGVCAWATFANTLQASPDVFTLDTNQSSITLSGTVTGFSISEQAVGSLTTKIGGTILLVQSGGFLQFPGGSQLILYTNGNWQPGAGGAAGVSAPGNFGGKASLVFLTAYAALRNGQLDLSSPALTLTGGNFNSSSLVFSFLTNAATVFDYNVPLASSGSVALTSLSTNNITTNSTLTTANGVETLTIPINTKFLMKLVTEGDSILNIQGQIVATRAASAPALSIGQITVSGPTVTLNWTAATGQAFNVLSTSDFKKWDSRATAITSTTGNYTWSGNTNGAAEYFRLSK